MAFRAYTIALAGGLVVSGFARSPERVRDLAVIDAARDTPWTRLGNLLKNNPTHTLQVRPENLSFVKAREVRNELAIDTLPMYSLVDDAYPAPGTLPETRTCPFYARAPFISDEAAGHFAALFVSPEYRPTEKHDQSAPEMIGFMFDTMLSRRNAWSNSMVYDKRQRKVVVYTSAGPEEQTMTAFLDAVIPWFVDTVVNCLKCLIHDDDIPDTEAAEAYHCLRKLHTVAADSPVTPVTVADVISGRVPGKTYKNDRTETRTIITDLMRKANLSLNHEKLRQMYPPTHPKKPNSKKYLKKLKELQDTANAECEWLKALQEATHKTNPEFWALK